MVNEIPSWLPTWLSAWIPRQGLMRHLLLGLVCAPQNFWGWFPERWDKMDLFDESHVEKAKTNPWYSLGGMWYWAWMIVIIRWFLIYIDPLFKGFPVVHAVIKNK